MEEEDPPTREEQLRGEMRMRAVFERRRIRRIEPSARLGRSAGAPSAEDATASSRRAAAAAMRRAVAALKYIPDEPVPDGELLFPFCEPVAGGKELLPACDEPVSGGKQPDFDEVVPDYYSSPGTSYLRDALL